MSPTMRLITLRSENRVAGGGCDGGDGHDGDGGGGDVVRVGLVRVAKAYGGGGKAEGGWRLRWRRR